MMVYISGPYSTGDVALNVRQALVVAEQIWKAGHLPVVPHLTHFWHLIFPHLREDWLRLDMEMLKRCDAMVRILGESEGADKEEEAAARAWNIPVFYVYEGDWDAEKLEEWLEEN